MLRGIGLSAAGIAAGWIAAHALASTLGVLSIDQPPGVVLFTAIAIVVLGVSLLASTLPALRAGTINPVDALRHE